MLKSTTYKDIFTEKMKDCKSKKDYKRLCKEMLVQFDVIDSFDENQYKLLSSVLGEDVYSRIISTALKMCWLEKQGIDFDILTIEESE